MIAGKETRETAVAMRKSMGKLGAKLTVWEQRRAWAALSIDRRRRNGPKNPKIQLVTLLHDVDGFFSSSS
jgi:hypothetical protein